MKKLGAVLLALMLTALLAGCGGGERPEAGEPAAESKGQAESPNPGITAAEGASSYSEAYRSYEAVRSAMSEAYEGMVEPHNAAIEEKRNDYWEDPEHFSDVVGNFLNVPIAFTATFGDAGYEAGMAELFDMFDMKEGKVEELGSGNYRMTYLGVYTDTETWEGFENVLYESLCGFDEDNGALYFREYATVNGERRLTSFMEFVPLGGGRYALQSGYERGIVELADGKAAAYDYAAFREGFDPEQASIFPRAEADGSWVASGGEMYQRITLTDAGLHIWAAATEGILSSPERDITIERQGGAG